MRSKIPSTAATRLLREEGVAYSPEVAHRRSGYLVGGTSPLGTRKAMPVFMERSVLDLPRIYVNGGSRGFLVGLAPQDLVRVLRPALVEVGIDRE